MKKFCIVLLITILFLTGCEFSNEDYNGYATSVICSTNITVNIPVLEQQLVEYIESKPDPNYYVIDDFECILQDPELPTGCEVVSLCIVLNHIGFDVDKCDLSDNYLTKIPVGSGTPYEGFLGNPRNKKDYGCYHTVIVDCANKYFDENGDKTYTVYDITGSELDDLLNEVYNSNPVIVWASIDMREMYYSKTWNIDGEKFTWKSPNHCMVLYGYDLYNREVYIADPMRGNTIYDIDTFYDRYQSNYSQAIVIK